MTLTVRRADAQDVPAVFDLVANAITWLASRGSDQWQGYTAATLRHGIARDIAHRDVWIAETCLGKAIATITLNENADPEFWTETDQPDSALYVHRMAVARSHAGGAIGTALLDWAADRAEAAGKTRLRLDAWSRNTDLHRYYEREGFTNIRTLVLPHRGSGALFERSVGVRLNTGPRITDSSLGRMP